MTALSFFDICHCLRTHTLECLNEATDTCIALSLFSKGLSRSLEGGMQLGKRKGLWHGRPDVVAHL